MLVYRVFILSLMVVSLVSCFQNRSTRRRKLNYGSSSPAINPAGSGSEKEDQGIEDEVANAPPHVELAAFIDPYSGTMTTKLHLPKNFNGYLYLYTRNAVALRDKFVKVRFNFGVDRTPIEIDATLASTSGLSPELDIQLLALNFKNAPMEGMRLIYQLFDYSVTGTGTNPITDDRDASLYCRGLRIEDDPTFVRSENNTECDESNEKCFYAYARIRDRALHNSSGYTTIPTTPLVDIGSYDFSDTVTTASQIESKNLNNSVKCLPDSGKLYFKDENSYKQLTYTSGNTILATLGQEVLTLSENGSLVNYTYQGPYDALDEKKWEITKKAIWGKYGVFNQSINNDYNIEHGIYSNMFPRAGTITLDGESRFYIGSSSAFSTNSGLIVTTDRSITSLPNGGTTGYMDGCNLRVNHYDKKTNEGYHSCNVTGTIEILTLNKVTNVYETLFSTRELKLLLVRPRLIDSDGEDLTYYEGLKSCEHSNACGKNECCYNNRCWSRDLVSQCLENVQVEGNKAIGESCTSDYQCTSFCCDQNRGKCSIHNATLVNPVYCGKAPGSQCVAKEWCRQDPIEICKVVKTGVNEFGVQTCAMRCFFQDQFGDCIDGTCSPPSQPARPNYNPATFDCSTAEVL